MSCTNLQASVEVGLNIYDKIEECKHEWHRPTTNEVKVYGFNPTILLVYIHYVLAKYCSPGFCPSAAIESAHMVATRKALA